MKKLAIVSAGLAVTLTIGGVEVADAAITHKVVKATNVASPMGAINPITSILATLVGNHTISQAQSDAITAALNAAKAAAPKPMIAGGNAGAEGSGMPGGMRGLGVRGFGGAFGANQALIASTLGITTTVLQADIAAGQSLATIAGPTKVAGLISALVAAETTTINAQLTAGHLTSAQAATRIAGLNAQVTAMVNATPTKVMGRRGHGALGGMPTTPGAPTVGGNN